MDASTECQQIFARDVVAWRKPWFSDFIPRQGCPFQIRGIEGNRHLLNLPCNRRLNRRIRLAISAQKTLHPALNRQ
jgi:hypothetical protein